MEIVKFFNEFSPSNFLVFSIIVVILSLILYLILPKRDKKPPSSS